MFVRKPIMLSLVAVLGLIAGALVPSQTQAQTPGVYRTASVRAFRQTVGSYGSSNLARVRSLAVGISSNRTITIAFPNTWYGTVSARLVPISGRPGYFSFSGARTANVGAGGNAVAITGVLAIGSNGRPIAMAFTSRAGNSIAAVVNNSSFGSSASSVYTATVTLR